LLVFFSKQVFDLEFLATDAGRFVPVYFSEADCAIGEPFRLRQRPRPYTRRRRASSRIPEPVAKVSIAEISPSISNCIH
jgi:hypothetical protein